MASNGRAERVRGTVRRRWPEEERVRIVQEGFAPGARVCEVARRNGLFATKCSRRNCCSGAHPTHSSRTLPLNEPGAQPNQRQSLTVRVLRAVSQASADQAAEVREVVHVHQTVPLRPFHPVPDRMHA